MTDEELDAVIHVQARLRIMVTLATLSEGDDLSFTRLQDVIGLTPGNLITHLRKLEDAQYVTTAKSGRGVTARTSVSITREGRAALDRYSGVLRGLLDSVRSEQVMSDSRSSLSRSGPTSTADGARQPSRTPRLAGRGTHSPGQ